MAWGGTVRDFHYTLPAETPNLGTLQPRLETWITAHANWRPTLLAFDLATSTLVVRFAGRDQWACWRRAKALQRALGMGLGVRIPEPRVSIPLTRATPRRTIPAVG